MNQFIEKLFLLKRSYKICIQVFFDAFLILLLFLLAMYLRLDQLHFLNGNTFGRYPGYKPNYIRLVRDRN